jgi:membrane fusion protein, adhesin transport system
MSADFPSPSAADTRRPSRMIQLLAGSVLLFGLWASVFEIDQTVRAQGQLIPGARTQVVQAVDGGVLSEIRVQEGERVKAGDVVAVLEPDRARAAYDESAAKFAALQVALRRAQAEAAQARPDFGPLARQHPALVAAQQQLWQQRKQGLQHSLAGLEQSLALAQEELAMNESLHASGDTSRVELLRARRQVAELQARLDEVRNKYLQDARAEAAKLEEELLSQGYRQAERGNVLEHTALTSPLDGVVKLLRVNTVGGVLRAGDEILQISPTEGELLLEVRINPADIGQLRAGQDVQLRLDAYDYTIFGSLEGELVYLSSDTLSEQGPNGQSQSFYRGRVRIRPESIARHPKLSQAELKPGMTASADIRTGQRSVLTYLIKPLARAFGGAMNER